MSENVIQTKNLTKVFEHEKAVDSLNLSVPQGSVFGFLGVNGAGKTTTVRMIVAHLHPTEGEAILLGKNPWKHSEADRCRVAYVSDNMHLPGWMTPEDAMRLNASLYPKWDSTLAKHLLTELDLHRTKKYQSLSRGEKRRLCLLLAICQNADVLILDEPASGLDVVARHKFLDLILEQVYDGTRTVFLSSHLLSDLERIIDRLAILHHGRVHLSGRLMISKQKFARSTSRNSYPANRSNPILRFCNTKRLNNRLLPLSATLMKRVFERYVDNTDGVTPHRFTDLTLRTSS